MFIQIFSLLPRTVVDIEKERIKPFFFGYPARKGVPQVLDCIHYCNAKRDVQLIQVHHDTKYIYCFQEYQFPFGTGCS